MTDRGHTPMRRCVGCRVSKPKNTLVRLVIDLAGRRLVDMEQRMDGRGYYLCRSMDCLRKGAKKLALPDGSEGMDRLKTFILHGV